MKTYTIIVLLLLCSVLSFAQGNGFVSKDSVEACYRDAVELFSAERFDEAVVLLKKVADSGLVDAQYDYGLCCYNGTGVAENPEECVAIGTGESFNLQGYLRDCVSEANNRLHG